MTIAALSPKSTLRARHPQLGDERPVAIALSCIPAAVANDDCRTFALETWDDLTAQERTSIVARQMRARS
jgi:hypothetical protein